MSEWRELSLGDVIELKRGYDLPKARRREGPVPIVSSSGPTGFHNEAKVRGPGVVTGRYGTLGEVFYVEEDFWPLNTSLYVRDFKGNNPRFVAALLSSLDLGSQDGAAAVPGLNRNHLHLLPVSVPDLPTQIRIASILKALDDLIENNRRRILLLEQMAQTIYREWFVHFHYPGHEDDELVDSPLGLIPAGWTPGDVEAVSSFVSRGITPRYAEDGASLVINQRCIRDGRIDLSRGRRQERAIPSERELRFGDVLINSTGEGTLGRVAQLYTEVSAMTVDTHVTIARPGADVNLDWYGLTLLAKQDEFAALAIGSTGQTELGRDAVKSSGVIIPPQSVQASFGSTVAPVRRFATILSRSSLSLVSTRDRLLPRLVSGAIDASRLDLDALLEEPAA